MQATTLDAAIRLRLYGNLDNFSFFLFADHGNLSTSSAAITRVVKAVSISCIYIMATWWDTNSAS